MLIVSLLLSVVLLLVLRLVALCMSSYAIGGVPVDGGGGVDIAVVGIGWMLIVVCIACWY